MAVVHDVQTTATASVESTRRNSVTAARHGRRIAMQATAFRARQPACGCGDGWAHSRAEQRAENCLAPSGGPPCAVTLCAQGRRQGVNQAGRPRNCHVLRTRLRCALVGGSWLLPPACCPRAPACLPRGEYSRRSHLYALGWLEPVLLLHPCAYCSVSATLPSSKRGVRSLLSSPKSRRRTLHDCQYARSAAGRI